MAMTYEQFACYATDLANRSFTADDDWHLREYRNPMASKHRNRKICISFASINEK